MLLCCIAQRKCVVQLNYKEEHLKNFYESMKGTNLMAIVISNFSSSGMKEVGTGTCDYCMGTMSYEDYEITFKDTDTGRERTYESLLSWGYGDYSSFPEIPNIALLSEKISKDSEAALPEDWDSADSLIWKHVR